jgi:hypothetical protein
MATSNYEVEEVLDYRPCWETGEVQQITQGLERLNGQKGKAIVQRRRCERKKYTAPVLITQHRKGKVVEGPRVMLHVVARNLSRSGIGLLAPLFFEPEVAAHGSPMLRAASLFREGAALELGLIKQSGSLLWVIGSVVRARTIQQDFLDIGIRFVSRRIQTYEFGV